MVEDRLDEALSPGSTISTESTRRRKRDPNIKTYYSSPEIRSRISRLRKEWAVNQSELTRWLLEKALDLVERGKIKPKVKTVKKVELD